MYTKLSFRKADCFSCHFASLKYTTYGKRIEIQGLTKSTAGIISPRGCVWELNERESSYLFISVLSGSLHHNMGKRNFIFGGWILLHRLYEVDLLERALSPQHSNSSGPESYENLLQWCNFLGKATRKSYLFAKFAQIRGTMMFHHLASKEGLSPYSQGHGQSFLK